MLLSLVDSLRCPADHEESPLVLSADAWRGTRISTGTLGCPVCHARYAIREGRVDFAGGATVDEARVPDQPSGLDPIRLAAQLNLAEPGGIILLTGRYAAGVWDLAALVDAIYVLVDSGGAVPDAAVSIELAGRIPFANGSFRGAAVDQGRATPEFLAEVARTVRFGGRVIAPVTLQLVDGLLLLAQDEQEWVAEVESTPPVVTLLRSPKR